MKEVGSELWEVLVPVANNEGVDFTLEHHREWDATVRSMTGGLTIMRSARGQWLGEDGNLYAERVIPVRIACDESAVRQIMDHTLSHYGQQAVMAYQVSQRAIILYASPKTAQLSQ